MYTLKIDYDDAQKIVVSILTDFFDDVVNGSYCENEEERIELAEALMRVLQHFTVFEQMAEIIEKVYDL